MLKMYKNGFVDLIRTQGLDPTSFHVEDTTTTRQLTDSETIEESLFTLQFMETHLKFVVTNHPFSLHDFAAHYTRFGVGSPESPIIPYPDFTYPHNIDAVYRWFNDWLLHDVRVYIDEMTSPDLWAQIAQQRQLVTATSLTPHEVSFFAEEEKPLLHASIRQFRLLVCKNFSPTQEQLKIIDERLDYLSKAVDRLNRFDWKGLALSIVVSISVNLCVDTDGGRKLLELFKQAFTGVLHLLQ
jgi:hypothetical protein